MFNTIKSIVADKFLREDEKHWLMAFEIIAELVTFIMSLGVLTLLFMIGRILLGV